MRETFRMDRGQAARIDRARGFTLYEEPNRLPDPIPDLGYCYLWVSTTQGGGAPDLENVEKMFRDGWRPVMQEEQQHILMIVEGRSAWVSKGCIEIGGCLLCKKPEELVEDRIRYYEEIVDRRLNSFRDSVLNMSRREMPITGEWKSYAEYGRDIRPPNQF